MKKTLLKILGAIVLASALSGCSTISSTKNNSKNEEAQGTVKDFDWNAKVEPVKLDRTYTEQNSGNSFTTRLTGIEKAQAKLESKKKSISDEKVKSALKVVDAVFVNQQNIDDLVKAAGYNNQKELFENVWKQTITDVAKEYNFTPNEDFVFQGETYKMSIYGPMSFKVNTNAYGKAGAYDLNDYKVEGNTVYLYITTPHIDNYQYFAKASYLPNFKDFFEPLALVVNTARSENKIGEVLNSRAIYNLAALEYKANRYVDLQGMDYHPTAKQYIAIQVDDSGKVTIDMENLQNLLHINSKKSNETNKVKFNIIQ